MTPSSLGTITAIFTTSWDPSTRCSRIGLRVSGLGWISAAIRGGGAPERRCQPRSGAGLRRPLGDRYELKQGLWLAQAGGQRPAIIAWPPPPAPCTETATTRVATPCHHQRSRWRAGGRSRYGAGSAAGGGRWSARGRLHFRNSGGGGKTRRRRALMAQWACVCPLAYFRSSPPQFPNPCRTSPRAQQLSMLCDLPSSPSSTPSM